ncbi:patatin-like phospholipase family protein [Carboxylicivirga taeanensis]|uniref:patatin-like phospholipase family protein n=1 Tax=Carboxylicivirga taeanensis TaxID=1416875 RepID=UPI003F6E02E2
MKNLLFIFVFCLILVLPGFSQRPKIGLTLSGGGAKGLAHVGVLKAIDQAGLKVDYITGTSMGSIIGAMYAVGYSGEQIEQIAGALNWERLLSGKPFYYDVSLMDKQEYENYIFSAPFRHGKLVLSTGLIESEEVWLKFSEIFFPVYDTKNFSDFDIPFKCVATDLSTGKAVVLDKGEIVFALRASMALPGIIKAVPYNNTKLVDGGIVRNFPVSDVKTMGADYVIGVNLYSGLSEAEELNSVLDVMYQIINYRDAEDLVKEKRLCDLIIEPPLDEYSAGSFNDVPAILEIGNEIGEKYYPYFKHLADSLNALYPAEYVSDNRLPASEPVCIDSIVVTGLEQISESMFLEDLDLAVGQCYQAHQLSKIFREAYSRLNYQYVYYEIEVLNNDRCVLHCKVKENPPSQLSLGLSYHSFTNAALTLGYSWRNLVFDRSYSLAKVNVSENWRIRLLHRQMFGKQLNHGMEAVVESNRLDVPIYDNDKQLYLYKGVFSSANLGYFFQLNTHNRVMLGGEYYNVNFNPSISEASVKGYLNRVELYASYLHNSLDRRHFPTTGRRASFKMGYATARKYHYRADYGGVLTDSTFTESHPLITIQFNHSGYHAISSRLSVFEQLHLGYIDNGNKTIFEDFIVGGIQPLFESHIPFAGVNDAQLHSNSVASIGLGAQYKVFGEIYTLLRGNVGYFGFNNPIKANAFDKATLLSGAALSVAYNSSALPLEFSVMYSPKIKKVYSHVNIGFYF